jgi:hypothetical protein
MKISKQSIFMGLSLALVLAFSLVTGCVSSQETKPAAEAATTEAAPVVKAAAGDLSDDTVRVPTEMVNNFWDSKDWDELTKAEQALWSFVGYTEAVWIGDAKNPPEEDLYWRQLKSKKREALEKMGYTKSFWDKGDPK